VVTLEDVARHAGVSLATASRVLNGSSRRVGAPLRERVELAAAELGYQPNATAQTLARGSSNVIGIVVHDLTDPYFAALATGAMRAADRHGLLVMVATSYRDPRREIDFVSTLRAQRVRAILLVGSRVSVTHLHTRLLDEVRRYRDSGGRVACVGQDMLGVDTIAPANREGAVSLARSLAGLGHSRFAVLAGPPRLVTAADRTAGFAAALEELGLPAPQVVHGGFDRDGGYGSALEVIGTDATCVFAVNDVMAVGALAALRDRGVSVPGDLSVAGFDDIPTLRDLVPALTTVRLPLAQMGERALELALDDAVVPSVERIEGEVILRASTRRL
jgi:LacI family transcriptional regulator, galactose operon repressor